MRRPDVSKPVPSELAAVLVQDATGKEHPLSDHWRGTALLIGFLRHFGCTGCTEHVTELTPYLRELASLGVKTVFVGNGEPRHIDGFVERHALADKGVAIVTDPRLCAFRAVGLHRSAWATFGPASLIDHLRQLVHGYSFHGREGDMLQQGGDLVIDAAGIVAHYHASKSIGGHTPPADLVDVALRIAASRAAVSV